VTNRLSPLQQDILRGFFQREDRFFLSGGGALAGFHLAHRETHDLDLFTVEDALDRGISALGGVARDLGATIEAIQTAPDFRRVLVQQEAEAVVVDLVREYVAQVSPEKQVIRAFVSICQQRSWRTNSARCRHGQRFVIWWMYARWNRPDTRWTRH
jgi:hypothetical protein